MKQDKHETIFHVLILTFRLKTVLKGSKSSSKFDVFWDSWYTFLFFIFY